MYMYIKAVKGTVLVHIYVFNIHIYILLESMNTVYIWD